MTATTDHAALEARLRSLTQRTLSSPARYFHVAVLVLALIMCSLLGALLLTEHSLPIRTQLAFVGLLALGAGWVAYAGWALATRDTLLVHQRLAAGWMAVAGTGAFFLCSAVAALVTTSSVAIAALAAAGTLLVGALVALGTALKRTQELRILKTRLNAL